MAIVNFKTGEVLTTRQIKQAVMKANGWTSEEYQKQYDILRNRVRNYEQTTGQALGGKIKVNELLYQTSKAQKRYGGAYKPSSLVRGIMATPSAGTGVVQRKGLSRTAFKRVEGEVLGKFTAFVNASRSRNGEAWKAYEGYVAIRDGDVARAESENKALTERVATLKTLRAEARKIGDKATEATLTASIATIREDIRKNEETIKKGAGAPKTLAELKERLARISKSAKSGRKNGFSIAGGY